MSVQKSWSELQIMARAARIVIDTLDALEEKDGAPLDAEILVDLGGRCRVGDRAAHGHG